MQDSYIGSTLASQAKKAGSIPVSCFVISEYLPEDATILLFLANEKPQQSGLLNLSIDNITGG